MNIDFIGRSKIWAIVSVSIIAVSVAALLIAGLNYSVEFTGGTSLDINFKQQPQVNEVRKDLAKFGLSKSIIQPVGDKGMMIRFRESSRQTEQQVVKSLKTTFDVNEVGVEQVGPQWGKIITNAAFIAFLFSMAAILLYISVRFEFKMAVAAIAALVHDILITLGVYALIGREVAPATIAALLTIMGYSLYDTIVVFHKIIENGKNIQRETYGNMVNRSLNQVVIRSLNTSLTSLLPVIAILVFGGETLKDFAFALMIGLLIGVYSSIFVASPLLSFWKETEPRYANLKKKYA